MAIRKLVDVENLPSYLALKTLQRQEFVFDFMVCVDVRDYENPPLLDLPSFHITFPFSKEISKHD